VSGTKRSILDPVALCPSQMDLEWRSVLLNAKPICVTVNYGTVSLNVLFWTSPSSDFITDHGMKVKLYLVKKYR
jgi:hypothetical protein